MYVCIKTVTWIAAHSSYSGTSLIRTDALGTEIIVLISDVFLFQRNHSLWTALTCHLSTESASLRQSFTLDHTNMPSLHRVSYTVNLFPLDHTNMPSLHRVSYTVNHSPWTTLTCHLFTGSATLRQLCSWTTLTCHLSTASYQLDTCLFSTDFIGAPVQAVLANVRITM